ncbi:MAG: hypothetical protein GF308_14000 [Candidatus Heimdallarchaeota archaeon]|nr:hypothetical protein [Candidatus Heimdallarchaeota archaeon]
MLPPEYRIGFSVLRKELGLWPALRVLLSAYRKARKLHFEVQEDFALADRKKVELKNHFKLFAQMFKELDICYGRQRAEEVIEKVLKTAGPVFMRGFSPIPPDGPLSDFIPIYKSFESQNLMFEVIEESEERFEIIVHRCLIYEAFKELGIENVAKWMCDVAFIFFNNYHSNLTYTKDRMIARGDDTCHEVFLWQSS